jgi:stage V sporulation protein B
MGRTSRGTLSLIISTGFFFLANFGLQVVLARVFSVEDYGSYSFIISLVSIGTLVLTAGFPLSASRMASMQKLTLRSYVDLLGVFIFVAILVCLTYIGLTIIWIDAVSSPFLLIPVSLGVPIVLTYSLAHLLSGTLNGLKEYAKQSTIQVIMSTSKFSLSVILVLTGWGITGPLVGQALSGFFGTLVAAIWIMSKITRRELKIDKQNSHLLFIMPVTVFYVILELVVRLGLIVVEISFPLSPSVGFYASALAISSIIPGMAGAATWAMFPSASLATSHKESRGDVKLWRSVDLILAMIVPMILLMAYVSVDILSIAFDPKYSDASVPLALLAVGMGFLAVGRHIATICIASGETKGPVICMVITVSIDLILLMVLIPSRGIEGAALATLVSSILATLIIARIGAARFGPPSSLRRAIQVVVIGLVASLFLLLPTESFPLIILKSLAFAATYSILLLITKTVEVNELKRLLRQSSAEED